MVSAQTLHRIGRASIRPIPKRSRLTPAYHNLDQDKEGLPVCTADLRFRI